MSSAGPGLAPGPAPGPPGPGPPQPRAGAGVGSPSRSGAAPGSWQAPSDRPAGHFLAAEGRSRGYNQDRVTPLGAVTTGRNRQGVSKLLPSSLIPLVVLFLLTSALPAFCEGVTAPASAVSAVEPGALLTPDDGGSAATATNVDVSALGGGWTWRGSQGLRNPETRGLARFTQRLGDARVVGQALLAGYVTGRITGLPNFSAASARVAGATFSAVVLCEGLRLAVGRARPDVAPGDPHEFRPFGGLDAPFPSGQTTVAFAAAAAIDEESQARWVSWVVYPVAAAVGLVQAHEDGSGLGDAAAGAALGFWAGRRVDQIERGQVRIFDRARFLVRGSPRNFRVGFKARF